MKQRDDWHVSRHPQALNYSRISCRILSLLVWQAVVGIQRHLERKRYGRLYASAHGCQVNPFSHFLETVAPKVWLLSMVKPCSRSLRLQALGKNCIFLFASIAARDEYAFAFERDKMRVFFFVRSQDTTGVNVPLLKKPRARLGTAIPMS